MKLPITQTASEQLMRAINTEESILFTKIELVGLTTHTITDVRKPADGTAVGVSVIVDKQDLQGNPRFDALRIYAKVGSGVEFLFATTGITIDFSGDEDRRLILTVYLDITNSEEVTFEYSGGGSAYDVAIAQGFEGTAQEWLDSLRVTVDRYTQDSRGDTVVHFTDGPDVTIETGEADRVSSENARVTAESERISAEDIRVSNEEDRQVNETTRIANEEARQENYDELVDTGIMEENIHQKLAEAEQEYAPRLTDLEQNDADLTAQLADTTTRINNVSQQADKVVGAVDDAPEINNKAYIASNMSASFVTTLAQDYKAIANLDKLADPAVLVGKGNLISANHNNRYFDIFDPRTSSGILTTLNPAYSFENIAKFAKSLVVAKSGGTKVKVTFVGDSLTQGSHRASDRFWWVEHFKTKLITQFGDYFEFQNRGYAGRKISSLSDIITGTVNAPLEDNWVTNSGVKTWVEYIEETSPDLIICAFGMNEEDANGYKSIVDGRNLLKGIDSEPDIVWVTTPIRTIDTNAMYNGSQFGTYPANEYSNNAGILTRLVAQKFGDPCIDVNRNTSINHLGLDPYQYRLDRWFGQYRPVEDKFTGNQDLITGGASSPVNINMAGGNSFTTTDIFRNFSIAFTPVANGTLNNFKITFRKDVNSINEVVVNLSDDRILFYGIYEPSGSFGELSEWTGDCRGKRVRVEAIGVKLRVHVEGAGWVIDETLYASQLIAPITLSAGASSCVLEDVVINKDIYKKYLPRISSSEVFKVYYGDGGNGLNHPNTKGELELYEQPMDEFIASLNNIELLSKLSDLLTP